MSEAISRREMVALLAAGAAAFGTAPARRLAAMPAVLQADDAELAAWLQASLGDADVTAIAAAWRERHPEESSRDALARALLRGRRHGEAVAAHIARTVTSDHAAGRVEPLDGWILSVTEGRLAALVQVARGQ